MPMCTKGKFQSGKNFHPFQNNNMTSWGEREKVRQKERKRERRKKQRNSRDKDILKNKAKHSI